MTKNQRSGENARNAVDSLLNGLSFDMMGGDEPAKQEIVSAISANNLQRGAFKFTPTGLAIDGDVQREDWEEVGRILAFLDTSLQWLIGDWVIAGDALGYGDRETFAQELGFKTETIYQFAWVARNVEISTRIEILSFGHHVLVTSMPQKEQKYWLDKARYGDGVDGSRWSVKRLRDEINAAKESDQPKQLTFSAWFETAKKRELKQARKYLDSGFSREQVARFYRQMADEIEGK